MKTVLKLAIGILVAVAVVSSIAFLLMNNSNSPSQSQTQNSAVLPSDSLHSTQNANPVVTITYDKGRLAPCGTGIMVSVSIKSDGYESFSPSSSNFVLTANGATYKLDYSDTKTLGWQNTAIPNGGNYDATLVFEGNAVPTLFVLSYKASADYNVVCRPK